MKVPFTASQNHQSVNPKPLSNSIVRNTAFQASTNSPNLCYEPKSVLDLRRSPSPIADKRPSGTDLLSSHFDDPLQWDDHVVNNFDDWDSLVRELGLHHDDSTSNPKTNVPQFSHSDSQIAVLPEFPPAYPFDPNQFVPSDFDLSDTYVASHQNANNNFNPLEYLSNDLHHMNHWNLGFDYVDELIQAAECFETSELQIAQVILTRLNQRLRSPVGRPLQRAAFYFKEALLSLITGSNRATRPSTSSEVVQAIKAYKTFANISPIPMFSNFTANQAILDAVEGSMIIHVIDFDIGLGGHWASFMREIADKAESRKASPPVLRITAVVPEEYAIESKLIRDNLTQFARELNIGFDLDFVFTHTFEYLSFKAIKFVDGEKHVVLLSPEIFRRSGAGFVNDLRRISPHVVVHVDSEGLMSVGTSSFRQTVMDGLEFYSTLLESLEAANVGGGGSDWIRRIETFVLFPKIAGAMECCGRRVTTPWREAFVGAGMRPVGLSQFADFQAECLLRRVQVKGFHVAKRQAEMVLCWHERPLVGTSAWRC